MNKYTLITFLHARRTLSYHHGLLSKKILENVNKFNLKVLKAPGEYLHYRKMKHLPNSMSESGWAFFYLEH